MEEVISPPHAAYAACTAVEVLLLDIILKKAALQACVGPKGDTARPAVCCQCLARRTQCTHKLAHSFAFKLVPPFWVLQCEGRSKLTHAI